MANLVFAGDSIVAAYVARITAAGGTISFTHLAAVRAFIATGQAEGWWEKIIDCCPFFGSNLAASLVKLVVAPGTATSCVSHNIIGGDYAPATGITIVDSAADEKYISTGFIPDDQGLTLTNMSFGIGSIIDLTFSGQGGLLGQDEPDTGAVSAIGANPAHGGGGFGFRGAGFGYNRCYCAAASFGPSHWTGSIDGIGTVDVAAEEATGPLIYEWELLRTTKFGDLYYNGNCNMCFYFFGTHLTATETRAITAAARQMHVSARQIVIGTHDVFIGDSITQGQGASIGWAERVVAARELTEPHYIATNVAQSGLGTVGDAFPYRYTGTGAYPVTIYFAKMGANDCSLGFDLAAYKQALLDMAIALKALNTLTAIVTISYQDLLPDPEDNAAYILTYVDAALEAAEEAGVLGIDTCRPMLEAPDPTIYLVDAVHLNDVGAEFVKDLVLDAYAAYRAG